MGVCICTDLYHNINHDTTLKQNALEVESDIEEPASIRSMPDNRQRNSSETKNEIDCVPKRKRKGSEPLFIQNYVERQNNPQSDFIRSVLQGEQQAEEHIQKLESDTASCLSSTFEFAETMVQIGNNINEELERNRRVIRSASCDLDASTCELHMIRNIMGSKFVDWVSMQPENKICHGSRPKNRKRNYMRRRSSSLPGELPSSKLRRSIHLKKGITKISSALDTIKNQQLGMKERLIQEERTLKEFGQKIDRTDDEIKHQSDQVYRKMGR